LVLKATVIIPTCNRANFLKDALESLSFQNFQSNDYEIIVVDNNSTDNTHEVVLQAKKKSLVTIYYVYEPKEGLHHARHKGADEANGSVLVYIDDDITVPADWLGNHVRHFKDDSVACVGGRVLPKWEGIPPPWMPFLHPGSWGLLDMGDVVRELKFPEIICGGNLSIRADVLKAIGGFHPDGFKDPDRMIWRGDGEVGMQRNIYQTKKKIIYDPDAFLYHRIPTSRLIPDYFFQRSWNEGFSANFTWFRKTPREPKELIVYSAIYYCISLLCRIFSKGDRNWITIMIRGYHYKFKARFKHTCRLIRDESFRKYVTRPSFWG
jgi:glucosyl-dolichyl phosphate glucuronosyltransferase